MKKKRVLAVVAILAASALGLAGCTPPYNSEVIADTEITVAWNDLIDNFNGNSAAGNNTANAVVLYMMNSTFLYYNDKPALVRNTGFGSFEKTSDDPLTVKYTINDGVKWSDGTPIDSADLLLAWTTIFAGVKDAAGEPLFTYANPRGDLSTALPVIDGNTITIVYDKAYVDWEIQFDLGVAAHGVVELAYPDITDPAEAKKLFVEAVQKNDVEWLTPVAKAWNDAYQAASTPDNALVALSSGAYVLDELVENEYVALKANPLYTWGPSPKYERIIVRQIEDSTAQVQAIENGDVQIAAGQPTPDVLELVKGLTNADFVTADESSYEHIDLTFDNGGPFDPATYGGDEAKARAVRQAFLKVVPRQEILDKLITPLNPNAALRDSILLIPGAPGYDDVASSNDSANYAKVDIDGAKKLLADAGVSAPVEVKFWYPEGNVRRATEFEFIQQSAALAGFTVVDDSEPEWAFTDREAMPINPHDATIFAWQSTSLALTGADQYLGSKQPSNFGGYSNSKVDGLLSDLETELDPAAQTALQVEIEKLVWDDAYGVTIFQFPGITVWNKSVTNVKPGPLSPTYFWNFWEWAPAKAE
ncbi:MAG: ABC transporter family substrate-binding protein [Rhodoglobus sp.]